MTRVLAMLLVASLGLAGACGGGVYGPPHVEVDRTACAHCGMLVSEPLYAAAYRAPEGDARVFDDIACLAASVRAEVSRDALVFWFRDADADGWIPGTDAVFVRSAALPTPMGGGLVAYRDHAAARRGAGEHGGEVVPSLAALLSAPAADAKGGGR